MNLMARAKREFIFLKRLLRLLKRVKTVDPASSNLVCDDFEAVADRFADQPAILFEGKTLTYAELDGMANRFAHWARARGLKAGDTVALLMPNRPEYIAIWLGLNKLGVVTALINNSLTGSGLAHCINISGASLTLVDTSTQGAFTDIEATLSRHQGLWSLDLPKEEETNSLHSLSHAIKGQSSVRPDKVHRAHLKAHDPAMYIYTSGTTGLPKAAKITNARAQLYMKAFAGLTHMKPGERLYNTLPLYHSTGGLCGTGAALLNGASMVIKRRFSASAFWHDVRTLDCTHIVYIGELCRYLINSPPSPDPADETKHKIKMAFGNGMRPEVWDEFKKRFNVPIIVEFYGSTEGNVSLFNLDGHSGAIGRAPAYLRSSFNIRLVKFDIESELPERRANGLCIECKPGEIGEAIGAIGTDARHAYTGYADKAASEKKILHDVFKPGDAWFRTGDLMKMDRDGYIYFVDRIGDTFRFKGENVSTSEVSECCARAQGVDEAIVYGVPVPHYDGKAGMVSLIVDDSFSIEAFGHHVHTNLPVYARPRFVRLLQHVETTGTFKYKKMDLVIAGFDPAKTDDPLYVMKMDATDYTPITEACMQLIESGQYRM
ncbi:long-chain-acyl-CoA synthetase [Asticcacaulis sp. YBE204]|uniref:long-chain-acyl-CoA synthetase n=1 Tax=Asticcacaulis sp. YBE204 TaxID=1282363 RepID=UPI0003C40F27|nr:long-chain-acyl-CoA synthetase [Asticcacaulis sp. YBE204]ESQ79988.1 acyl-CoA synthetase [Asticcacaulis sp. YBE204]